MFKFEELRIYKESLLFINDIYLISQTFPKFELFGLTDQLHRASVSIALNIAEGTSRTKKEFRHFLDVSRGSCYECVAIITIAKTRSYISEDQYNALYENCEKLSKMISALKRSLQ